MPDDLRYIPPNSLVEVIDVTVQNRYLLRPSDELNDITVGVFGKAQAMCDMTVVSLTVLSTHYHALLIPRDAAHMAEFMGHVNGNLSKEVNRLHNWSGSVWKRRYKHVPVSDEEEAQIARLKYVLAQGVKENLVSRCADWPGVHSVDALVKGEKLIGHWFDRTKEYAARQLRRESEVDPEKYATEYELKFSPLPCWAHHEPAEVCGLVAGLVKEIEEEGGADRQRTKKKVLGVKKIRNMDPHYRPETIEKSPKPRFHTKTRKAFKRLLDAYREVLQAHREASERLRNGDRYVNFPEGTFAPAWPFVPFLEDMTVARGQPV